MWGYVLLVFLGSQVTETAFRPEKEEQKESNMAI
jgi:putative Mn2+ efflux pump MntP